MTSSIRLAVDSKLMQHEYIIRVRLSGELPIKIVKHGRVIADYSNEFVMLINVIDRLRYTSPKLAYGHVGV